MPVFKKSSPFHHLAIFYCGVNLVLRIVLIFHPITQTPFVFNDVLRVLSFGLLSDILVFVVMVFFLWLYLIFLSNTKYNKPFGYFIFALLCTLLAYVSSGRTILNEYGSSLPAIGIIFVGIKTMLFGGFLFMPKYRNKVRYGLFSIAIFIYVMLILQNAISEFLFWSEFGVRYNFIAVDYLIYTNEVIGNITQSYPVIPILTGLFLVSIVITVAIVKKSQNYIDELPTIPEKLKLSVIYLSLFGFSLFAIPMLSSKENTMNVFADEIQANGLYKFYLAFKNNELDYFKFYKTLPEKETYALLNKQIPGSANAKMLREIKSNAPEIHKNVVLITVESLSADFMEAYGNNYNLTPFLDSLATKSLLFTNCYAVGNRTVRGLEALTLCLPPTAGESVMKREDNKSKFTTGNLFAKREYSVKFLYGGQAYFDNMADFFTGNGYSVVDQESFRAEEITFSNVWGVCDEDMAVKAIRVMDEESKSGKPFFNHWMTVSNHRPFTYPDGKIDISVSLKSREGGVKYTDYALRRFFEMAQKQSWFADTVFIILADHCASSSGKTELPLEKYRIPALVYSPRFIAPLRCNKLISQIDIMPTVFGLLHFNYESKFYGQDVLKDDYKPRAFIATYQNLGLIKDNVLTVLSPKRQVKQYDLIRVPNQKNDPDFQLLYDEKPLRQKRNDLINETISYYQTASDVLKNKKYELN